jgi:G:T-mismatch repair DNA endonuclease (very short patch repair protein)
MLQTGGGLPFRQISESRKYLRKFRTHAIEHVLEFSRPPPNVNVFEFYQNNIECMVNLFKRDLQPQDRIGIKFKNSGIAREPLCIYVRPAHQLSADTVWALIFRATQSNAEFLLEGTVTATIAVIDIPRGYGRYRNRRNLISKEDFCQTSRSLIFVDNAGQDCLAHGLVLAIHSLESSLSLKTILKDRNQLALEVQDLCELANCDLRDGGSIQELNQFQAVMPPGIQIVVFRDLGGKAVFYKGDINDPIENRINLVLYENHFAVIRSLTAAFGCSYYCQGCNKPYEHRGIHTCVSSCSFCHHSSQCIKTNIIIKCTDCNRTFYNRECYERHIATVLTADKTVCNVFQQCKNCFQTYKNYDGRKKHICNEYFCKTCREHVQQNHKCYMKQDKKRSPPSDKDVLIVFWDSETTQDIPVSENANDGTKHKVNLIVCQTQCVACKDLSITTGACSKCGLRQHIFKEDPVKDFIRFINYPRKSLKKVICIAHNFKGFDSHFLIEYILTATNITPELIMKGAHVLCMQMGHIKMIDSLNFMQMSLSKLPQTLGLNPSLKKGWFPHLFNTDDNKNYSGPYPDIAYYDPDGMSTQERSKLIEWHTGKIESNEIFNLEKELTEYCISDVSILREACNKFRKLIIDVGNVDPLTECITLASIANKVFRRKFLKDNVIGILPPSGYRFCNRQSKIGIKWLLSKEREYNTVIQHSGNAKEYRVASGHIVDGFATINNKKTIFEFNGCYYHACPKCYPYNNTALKTDPTDTMRLRREKTLVKERTLKALGYDVISIYECEFNEELRNNPELKAYLDNHPVACNEPINARDCLYGGRTNGLKLFHECTQGEEMHYVDFMSLYPDRCKYFKIPIGHPKVHIGPYFPDIFKTEGIIKCIILPPRDLYIPVLPTKLHDKLMFVLCRSCAFEMHQAECYHQNEDDRVLTGTWVIDEVRKAVQLGYRIISVIEIWEYKIAQYNPVTRKGGVFADYINLFLKIKQESSGWPEWCVDDTSKQRYVHEFFEHEGILLNIDNIFNNPGLRFVAKALLNSLWGRFALNILRSQTEIIRDPERYYKLLSDPNFEVNSLSFFGEDVVVANYEILADAVTSDPTINVVVAAYITTGARLKLYECLERLGNRVFYFDTDSILYLVRPGDEKLPLGNNLGDLTNELSGYGHNCYVSKFLCGGPKSYGIEVVNANGDVVKTIMKVRGITLNYRNSEIVNFAALERMLLHNGSPRVVHNPRKIVRTKTHEIVSRPESKVYRTVYTKRRRIIDTFNTLPYGHM